MKTQIRFVRMVTFSRTGEDLSVRSANSAHLRDDMRISFQGGPVSGLLSPRFELSKDSRASSNLFGAGFGLSSH